MKNKLMLNSIFRKSVLFSAFFVAVSIGVSHASLEKVQISHRIKWELDHKHNIKFTGPIQCFEKVLNREVIDKLLKNGEIALIFANGSNSDIEVSRNKDEIWFITKDEYKRKVAALGRYEAGNGEEFFGLIPFDLKAEPTDDDPTLHGTFVVDLMNGLHLQVANGALFLDAISPTAYKTGKPRNEMSHPDKNYNFLINGIGNLLDAGQLKLTPNDVNTIDCDEAALIAYRNIKENKWKKNDRYKKITTERHQWRIDIVDRAAVLKKLVGTQFDGTSGITISRDSALTLYFAAVPFSMARKGQNKDLTPKQIEEIKKPGEQISGITITESLDELLKKPSNSRFSGIKSGISRLRILKDKLARDPKENMYTLSTGFSSINRVSTFSYSIMKRVLEDIKCDDPWRIFDPFGGWGDRMISACLLSQQEKYKIEAYRCSDVNASLKEVYEKIKRLLGSLEKGIEILFSIGASEEISPDDIRDFRPNLVLTSPPYPGFNGFGLEMYSRDEGQSYLKYKTLDDWREKFMKRWVYNCLDALSDKGYLVINIADGSFGSICLFLLEQVEKYRRVTEVREPGGPARSEVSTAKFLGAFGYILTTNTRQAGQSSVAMEPIFIWQKVTNPVPTELIPTTEMKRERPREATFAETMNHNEGNNDARHISKKAQLAEDADLLLNLFQNIADPSLPYDGANNNNEDADGATLKRLREEHLDSYELLFGEPERRVAPRVDANAGDLVDGIFGHIKTDLDIYYEGIETYLEEHVRNRALIVGDNLVRTHIQVRRTAYDGNCGFTALDVDRNEFISRAVALWQNLGQKVQLTEHNKRFMHLMQQAMSEMRVDNIYAWAAEFARQGDNGHYAVWLDETHMRILTVLFNYRVHIYTVDLDQDDAFIPLMGPAAVIFHGADADTAQDVHLGLVAVEEGQALTHYERLILQAQPAVAPNLANQPTIIEAGERSAVEEQSNSMMQNIVNGFQGITTPALALVLTATEFAKTKK